MKWKSVVSTENSAESICWSLSYMKCEMTLFLKILVFVTSKSQNLSSLKRSTNCDSKCKNDNIDAGGGDYDGNNTIL